MAESSQNLQGMQDASLLMNGSCPAKSIQSQLWFHGTGLCGNWRMRVVYGFRKANGHQAKG